jgi:spermidine/putrescine-binding protein
MSRREFGRRLVLLSLLPATLVAVPARARAASITLDDIRNASGQLNVLGSQVYEVPATYPKGVSVKYAYNVTNEEIITKTTQPGTFDLVVIYQGEIDQLRKLDRIIPIDTSLIENWGKIGSLFRNSDVIRRGNDVYAVPYQWGHSYLEYNSDEMGEPKSFEDLMSSKLSKKVGLPDDPYAVISTFAVFAGAKRPNNLNRDEFDKTIKLLKSFRSQVLTIHAYGEEPQLFARRDIYVGFPEFSSSIVAAKKAGATNMKFSLLAAWSYVDCLMLLKRANNVAAAYAYMNNSLSDASQMAITAHSQAFPVNDAAIKALPEQLQYKSSDEVLASAPLLPGVTVEQNTPDIPFQQWVRAWEEFKAS